MNKTPSISSLTEASQFAQEGASADGMPHAGAVVAASGVKAGARGGAGGAGVVIAEVRALRAERVEVRRAQPGVSVAGEVAVTLVVGEDENDAGLVHLNLECGKFGVRRRVRAADEAPLWTAAACRRFHFDSRKRIPRMIGPGCKPVPL